MSSNLGIIISREFSEHVAKKSFIITTLLMPILMLGLMAAPTLIAMFSTPSEKTIAVIDDSGIVLPALQKGAEDIDYLQIVAADGELADAIGNSEFDCILHVNKDVVTNPSGITLYNHNASSLDLEQTLSMIIKDAVEEERIKAYNIDNIRQIMEEISVDINLNTIRITESGEGESTSSMLSFIIGLVMTFLLYMFLLMYGQMVLTSIIEEKNNRVLELVVSSVKPLQLMLGKIIGVGLVAVTQVAIWCVLLSLMVAFVMPALLPSDIAAQVATVNAGPTDMSQFSNPEIIQAIALVGSVGFILKLFGYILLFLVGGFLFYASIFAAIGSAVDNIQDASQLQSFAILPIIVAMLFSLSVTSDPNSSLAVWMSIIPFTSPMVMLARIPFDIASWQIWTSVGVLYLSFVVMAWIAAKIYRVGIFMYGKKPTIKDLYRWSRYK